MSRSICKVCGCKSFRSEMVKITFLNHSSWVDYSCVQRLDTPGLSEIGDRLELVFSDGQFYINHSFREWMDKRIILSRLVRVPESLIINNKEGDKPSAKLNK